MPLLSLPTVGLCAVDTRTPALAAESLRRSLAQVAFARAWLFTDAAAVRAGVAGGDGAITAVAIAPIDGGAGYSRFVLHELPHHVDTAHLLVTQWDGFVIDAHAWRDDFLDWDYIGAPWPEQPTGWRVGNGGFSLRSRRCLQAGLDPLLLADPHPEDEALCRRHRAQLERAHGLRFAPEPLARAFAFENARPDGATFGFHGPRNLPRVLDEATLARWLDALPDAFFRSRDARRLARALLARGMPHTARSLLVRRRAAGRREPATAVLALAAALLARLTPASTR